MTQAIDIDGCMLHYTKNGEGAPVILMHGWGCNHSTVASIEAIAKETHTVYNIDFPGFGESPEPNGIWGVEDYTKLVERFAETMGINRPILIGHSFGGRVGILFASRKPVDKLVLVDAAGIKPKRSLKYYLKIYAFKAYRHALNLFLGKERAQKKIEERRARAGSADYRSATPLMRSILSKVVNEDLTSRLHLIKAPTLLIWGENDTATPLSDAKKMEKLIPDAGLVAFPGCGHYSFLDNPRQFAAVLKSFLAS